MGAIFNVRIFMSPVQEMKEGRGKCIFYGSLPQETGGLPPMGTSLELSGDSSQGVMHALGSSSRSGASSETHS